MIFVADNDKSHCAANEQQRPQSKTKNAVFAQNEHDDSAYKEELHVKF